MPRMNAKEYFGLKNSIRLAICFQRSVHKVILEKKWYLTAFFPLMKSSILQLEKSTKYCKKWN